MTSSKTAAAPYLPAEFSLVEPDSLTRGFWENCKQHRLSIQRCTTCKTFRQPPKPVCHKCRSFEWEWAPVSGKGTVYSYTAIYHPLHPSLAERVPYNVVVVALDGAPGCRFISNLVDVPPEELKVGMPVEVTWEQINDEIVLPRFRRAKG
jgi:uncharacterized OB-fold protein